MTLKKHPKLWKDQVKRQLFLLIIDRLGVSEILPLNQLVHPHKFNLQVQEVITAIQAQFETIKIAQGVIEPVRIEVLKAVRESTTG